MSIQELVVIGKILGPHGINGLVKIQPLTDFPERFQRMIQLDVYYPGGQFYGALRLEEIRYLNNKGYFIARLQGISSRNEAETLRGYFVKVPKDQRVVLEKGDYWVDDIVGLQVVLYEQGTSLGRITEVLRTGEVDIYQVLTDDGKMRYLPAVSDFIRNIDLTQGIMEVVLLEGLWE
ncbi:MAG TPA: ribosome maturation factor RimM [Synergistales bacterium]|nr:ribosome maturation factor RimM [Synergistales bacterium]